MGENGAVYTVVRQHIKPGWLWASCLLVVGFSFGAGFGWFVRPDPSREMIQREIAIAVEAEHLRADHEIATAQKNARAEIARVTDKAVASMSEALAILGRHK